MKMEFQTQAPATYRMLVVDDSMMVRRMIYMALGGTEFKVVSVADTGETALSLYPEVKPDLVLLDIILPGMQGWEVLTHLRKTDPNARVVMVTAVGDLKAIRLCRRLGAIGYVQKPFRVDQLLSELRRSVADAGACCV